MIELEGCDFSDIDLNFFDLEKDEGRKKNPLRETRIKAPKVSKKVPRAKVKYKNAEKMAKDVAEKVINGERVDAVVSGSFIFGDFIEALIVDQNWLVEDMTISTLSVSKDNIDSLANLINGDYVQSLNLLVSDYFYSHNRVNIGYIYENLDIDNKFQLSVASVHTKIILIRLSDGRKIVIHGSANFRSSACVELFTIETDTGLYDFHAQWHNDIIEMYKTIKKPIRKREPFKFNGEE